MKISIVNINNSTHITIVGLYTEDITIYTNTYDDRYDNEIINNYYTMMYVYEYAKEWEMRNSYEFAKGAYVVRIRYVIDKLAL